MARSALLGEVFEAHGGLERWARLRLLTATVSLSGRMVDGYGLGTRLDSRISIDPRRMTVDFFPFGEAYEATFMTEHVWTAYPDGKLKDAMLTPKLEFSGPRRTRRTPLHGLYLIGPGVAAAMLGPFLYAGDGVCSRDGPVRLLEGRPLRTVELTLPDWMPGHGRAHTVFVDDERRIRRVDQRVDVTGEDISDYRGQTLSVEGLSMASALRINSQRGWLPGSVRHALLTVELHTLGARFAKDAVGAG
jgi:hypothetical protein